MGGAKWTPDEDAIVRDAGTRHGLEWDGWADVLPNRSASAIAQRKVALGVVGPKSRMPRAHWTDAERAALLRCLRRMLDATGHGIDECIREYRWMRRKVKSERKG
jgi:hypothetical protein